MADDQKLLRIEGNVDEIDAGFDAFDRFRADVIWALRVTIRAQTRQLTAAVIGALTICALLLAVIGLALNR
jgi:hypothetical protein